MIFWVPYGYHINLLEILTTLPILTVKMRVLQALVALCLLLALSALKAPITTKTIVKLRKIVRSKSLALFATPAPSPSASTSSSLKKRVYTSSQTIIEKIITLWKKLYTMIIVKSLNWFIALRTAVTKLLGIVKNKKENAPPKEILLPAKEKLKYEPKDASSTNTPSSDDSNTRSTSTMKVDENQWVENKLKEIETLEVDTKAAVTAPVVAKKASPVAKVAEDTVVADEVGPYDVNAVYGSDVIPSIIKVPKRISGDGVSFDIVKSKGTAGIVAYVITEVLFWALVIPIIIASYHGSNQEWLDFSNPDDRAKIIALAGVYVTSIRLAVPLRLGVAVAIIPWVEENITNNLFNNTVDDK